MTEIKGSVLTTPWISSPSDGIISATLETQLETESIISSNLTQGASLKPLLNSSQHLTFLTRILANPLPPHYTGLDASRPWLLYWVIHSLGLFEADLDAAGKQRVIATLKSCQNPDGGFGGGPGQISHLAPSYCSVVALAYIGEEGYDLVDRKGMYNFLLSVKQADGSFIMHEGGEVDVRGCYCALTVATLLNILTPSLALNTSSFIASCQTYEGGLAAASHPCHDSREANPPLGEAHGGYTFCAIASYILLKPFTFNPTTIITDETSMKNRKKTLNLKSLLRWASSVQGSPIEGGGVRGRTNKLVDGCYSWWGGGLFALISGLMEEEQSNSTTGKDLYNRVALQEYVLRVAQAPGGGLRDKPGKGPDAYHTCYNLSGYSSAQHKMVQPQSTIENLREEFISPFGAKLVEVDEDSKAEVEMILDLGESEEKAAERMKEIWARSLAWEVEGEMLLLNSDETNELVPTHPIFNVTPARTRKMLNHFYSQV